MKTIYLVIGEAGEWSDRRDWYVAATRTEDEAKILVERNETWLRENHLSMGNLDIADYEVRRNLTNPYDPQFISYGCEYSGARYYCAAVTLVKVDVPASPVR